MRSVSGGKLNYDQKNLSHLPLLRASPDRVFVLPNGELCCPPCFKDYLLNELDNNMDLFADALGIPVLYTEGPNADI